MLLLSHTTHVTRTPDATHDLKSCLQTGENVLGVELGNGWFASAGGQPGSHKTPPQLLLQANILANGKDLQVISSSTQSFKVHEGPIVYDSLYNGETYDSRKELKGWSAPGFDDTEWVAASPATTDSASAATLSSQLFEPIREISELKPVEITEPKPGMFVVDFGQNIAGFVRLTMRDTTAGQNVTLRFSELKMHPPYGAVDGTL